MIHLRKISLSVFTIETSIQSLAIELFEVDENLTNRKMSDIFPTSVLNYNLSLETHFFRNTVIPQSLV